MRPRLIVTLCLFGIGTLGLLSQESVLLRGIQRQSGRDFVTVTFVPADYTIELEQDHERYGLTLLATDPQSGRARIRIAGKEVILGFVRQTTKEASSGGFTSSLSAKSGAQAQPTLIGQTGMALVGMGMASGQYDAGASITGTQEIPLYDGDSAPGHSPGQRGPVTADATLLQKLLSTPPPQIGAYSSPGEELAQIRRILRSQTVPEIKLRLRQELDGYASRPIGEYLQTTTGEWSLPEFADQ